jgi:hypothetical protein
MADADNVSGMAMLIDDKLVQEDEETSDLATETTVEEDATSCNVDAKDDNVIVLTGGNVVSAVITLEVELTSMLVIELDISMDELEGSMIGVELFIEVDEDARTGTAVVAEDAIESDDVGVKTFADDDAASMEPESELEIGLDIDDAGVLYATVGVLNRLETILESIVADELALKVVTVTAKFELLKDSIDENDSIFGTNGRLDTGVEVAKNDVCNASREDEVDELDKLAEIVDDRIFDEDLGAPGLQLPKSA